MLSLHAFTLVQLLLPREACEQHHGAFACLRSEQAPGLPQLLSPAFVPVLASPKALLKC